jgi:transcriptional regulator with XRE-family HTH domain
VFTREYEIFVTLLIEARKKAGLSQQELAARLKKPQSFVSKYERGERRLDVVEFLHVARALGVPATEIITEIEKKLPPVGGGAP